MSDESEEIGCGCPPPIVLDAWHKEQMEKHGWFIHYVPEDEFINCHTHGLPVTFGHPDLQIVMPLPPQVALGVVHSAVDEIKAGRPFNPGEFHGDVIQGYDVDVCTAIESGRPVLRVILPAADGVLGERNMHEPYREQYTHVSL